MLMQRKLSVTVVKPIIVGSYSFKMNPMEKYGEMTHRWTCLLRSPKNENISYFIKKVTFELDPSFLNSTRTLHSPPFEVTEAGWGEFYIHVKLYFVDESIEPVKLTHYLKLNATDVHSTSPCVSSETYDECIFHEPHEWFYEKLTAGADSPPHPHPLQEYFLNLTPREKEQRRFYRGCQSYIQKLTHELMAEATLLTTSIQRAQQKYYSTVAPSMASGGTSMEAPVKLPPYLQGQTRLNNGNGGYPVGILPEGGDALREEETRKDIRGQ